MKVFYRLSFTIKGFENANKTGEFITYAYKIGEVVTQREVPFDFNPNQPITDSYIIGFIKNHSKELENLDLIIKPISNENIDMIDYLLNL